MERSGTSPLCQHGCICHTIFPGKYASPWKSFFVSRSTLGGSLRDDLPEHLQVLTSILPRTATATHLIGLDGHTIAEADFQPMLGISIALSSWRNVLRGIRAGRRTARWQPDGHGCRRHSALARTGRAVLQRVPTPPSPQASGELRGTDRQRRMARTGSAVYNGGAERVDLTVGMFAGPLPVGFAFSDTAFRIFVLMASRRLNSDRFFTTDDTPLVYTHVGIDWINDNDLSSVLLRHYPQLGATLAASRMRLRPGALPVPEPAFARANSAPAPKTPVARKAFTHERYASFPTFRARSFCRRHWLDQRRRTRQYHHARAARRGAWLSPILGSRTPQHAARRQHDAPGTDRTSSRHHIDDQSWFRRVMLPNHPSLVVAEQFALLEALHPGRIDLGIGRAPGTDPSTAAALRRAPAALGVEEFPRHLLDLMGLLGDRRTADGMWNQFAATPAATSTPTIVLLGSSGYSAQLAGQLGLPFAFANHFDTGGTLQAIELYRRYFEPSAALERPYVIVTASVLAAEAEEAATWFAAPGQLVMLALRTGRAIPLLSPEAAANHPDLGTARRIPTNRIVGTPDATVVGIEKLIYETAADEIMVATLTHGIAERVRSLELLAHAWQDRVQQ